MSRNDWAAAKPVGETGAWPERHEGKREEAGEKMCQMGGQGDHGGKQFFEEGMEKIRCQKVQMGEENWEKGKLVCRLSSERGMETTHHLPTIAEPNIC